MPTSMLTGPTTSIPGVVPTTWQIHPSHLPDVDQFAKTTFSSTRVEGRRGDPRGGERAGLTAQGDIDSRDFGLIWNQPLPGDGVVVAA